MKKETMKRILFQKTPKKEEKEILKGMMKKQDQAIDRLKKENGDSDFESHYKRGNWREERISKTPSKKKAVQREKKDDIIPFIESANSAIERLKANDLELVQTSGLDTETNENKVIFQLWREGKLEGSFNVFLESEKVTTSGFNESPTAEKTRKKIESIFKPYFSAKKI